MSYQITDFDELQIHITDGWREWYIPKFRIYMTIAEPVCYLYWTDTEKGSSGLTRMLPLDYNDVAFGYSTPSSASEVETVIEMYQISAFGGSSTITTDQRSLTGDGSGGDPVRMMYYDEMWSAGALSGFGFTDNLDGTCDIASGTAVLRTAASQTADLTYMAIPAVTSFALTDNSVNYIYVDYNGGTGQIAVTTLVTGFNCMDKCIIYKVVRDGNTLYYQFAGENNVDSNRKDRRRMYETDPLKRGKGTAIPSETGTRNLAVTDGIFWYGFSRYTTATIDTSATDDFQLVYDNGAGFTYSTETQINNTQYNNAGTLTAMTGNKWRCDEIWMMVNTPSVLYVVLGTAEYNSQDLAEKAPLQSSVPLELEHLGARIGRVIIQKSAAVMYVYPTAEDVFIPSAAIDGGLTSPQVLARTLGS